MDQSTELVVDPIILVFLSVIFLIGAIGPFIFCVWGAYRDERMLKLAATAKTRTAEGSGQDTQGSAMHVSLSGAGAALLDGTTGLLDGAEAIEDASATGAGHIQPPGVHAPTPA